MRNEIQKKNWQRLENSILNNILEEGYSTECDNNEFKNNIKY